MSYEMVNSIKFNRKDNKIYVTSCSSNVKPLHYIEWEVDYPEWWRKYQGYTEDTFDAKLHLLFENLLSGALQLNKTNANKKVIDAFEKSKDKEIELYGENISDFAKNIVMRQQLTDMKLTFDVSNTKEIERLWWNVDHDFNAYQHDTFMIQLVCEKLLAKTFIDALGI